MTGLQHRMIIALINSNNTFKKLLNVPAMVLPKGLKAEIIDNNTEIRGILNTDLRSPELQVISVDYATAELELLAETKKLTELIVSNLIENNKLLRQIEKHTFRKRYLP